MNRLGKILAIVGTLLQSGIVVGFVVTLIQMGRAMSVLDPSEPMPRPEVAAALQISFRVVGIGLIMGFAGGLFTLAALFGCRYRAPWLHSVLCVLSIFWLVTSPLVGLAMIAYLVLDRKSFMGPSDSSFTEPGESVQATASR